MLTNNQLYFVTAPFSPQKTQPRQLWMMDMEDFGNMSGPLQLDDSATLFGYIFVDEECQDHKEPWNLAVVYYDNTQQWRRFYIAGRDYGNNETIPGIPPFVAQRASRRSVSKYVHWRCRDGGISGNLILAAGPDVWGSYLPFGFVAFPFEKASVPGTSDAPDQIYDLGLAAFDYDSDALYITSASSESPIYVLTPSTVLALRLPEKATAFLPFYHVEQPSFGEGQILSQPVSWQEGVIAAYTVRQTNVAIVAFYINSTIAWRHDFPVARESDASAAAVAFCSSSSVVFSNTSSSKSDTRTADVLYLVDNAGTFYSLLANTGALLWMSNATAGTDFATSRSAPVTPVCDDDSAFVVSSDTTSLLRLSSRDGAVLWKSEVTASVPQQPASPGESSPGAPLPPSDPLLVEDLIIFYSGAAGVLSAVSRFSGAASWVVPLLETRLAQLI